MLLAGVRGVRGAEYVTGARMEADAWVFLSGFDCARRSLCDGARGLPVTILCGVVSATVRARRGELLDRVWAGCVKCDAVEGTFVKTTFIE